MFAVDIDGSNHHQVASWELGGGNGPVFSPDGLILFRSFEGEDSRQSDYWNVRPDGTRLRQLTRFKQGTPVVSASSSPEGPGSSTAPTARAAPTCTSCAPTGPTTGA